MKQETTYRYNSIEEYRNVLKNAPIPTTIKHRELGNGKSKNYVPIEVQEATADLLFREWNVIDETYSVVINELVCTVKLSYIPDFPGADMQYCTGSASKAIQCSTGSAADTFPAGKITNSLEYNLPSARKSAVSNALEGLGNLFGRNTGRKTVDNNFSFAVKKAQGEEVKKAQGEEVKKTNTVVNDSTQEVANKVEAQELVKDSPSTEIVPNLHNDGDIPF